MRGFTAGLAGVLRSISRVQIGILLSIVLIIGICSALTLAVSSERAHSAGIMSYVDPMPILPHIKVMPGQTDLTIHLQQFSAQLNSGFTNPTVMWGYDGMSPGPVIDVESGWPIRVHWQNDLPTTHIFASPANAMSTGPVPGDKIVLNDTTPPEPVTHSLLNAFTASVTSALPDVRNVTHLHGAVVTMGDPTDHHYNNDGWPDSWTVPGQEQVADYPNPQDARTLFFHDHAVGDTGRNVATGLAGVYLIHDDFERSLNLPSGQYDIPIVFMALGWKADGTRYYTYRVDNEFYGNGVLVNGKYLPFLAVEPRKYRFRLINADNARSFGFSLVTADQAQSPGPAFYQIASDGGFLEQTAVMSDGTDPNSVQLVIAPGERADVIIDFSKFAGQSLLLLNTGALTDPDGELPLTNIMQFKVAAQVTAPDTSSLPTKIRTIEHLDPSKVNFKRQIVLSQVDYPDGSSLFQINHRSWEYSETDTSGNTYWDYKIAEQAVAGTTEEWDIVNTSVLIHPFHIHLVNFQILDRRRFDADQFNSTGQIVYTGPAIPPDPNETAWKDVVRSPNHMVTRILVKFPKETGYYVYHCHILEHEDMDMMLPFQVLPAGSTPH